MSLYNRVTEGSLWRFDIPNDFGGVWVCRRNERDIWFAYRTPHPGKPCTLEIYINGDGHPVAKYFDVVGIPEVEEIVTETFGPLEPEHALAATEADRQERQSEAEEVCGEAYQVVGSLLSDLGIFETLLAEKILDNLSQAKMVHDDVLPWPSFDRKRRGEPVAWMYEHDGCIDAPIITTKRWKVCAEPWSETPLYNCPQPADEQQGEVVITKDESGYIVAVTRQDDEGRILSVIAEAAQPTVSVRSADGHPCPGAMKYDSDKPQLELLLNGCPAALEALGAVLTYGVEKYGGKHGWKELPDAIPRYESALLRHLLALAAGESHDPESGFPHEWHVATNALFLVELRANERKYQ